MKLLNMDGIQKPVALSAINQFEKQNSEISVNVLYLDDAQEIVPIRTAKFSNQRKHHVILLMLSDQNNKFHYTSVQSLSRLVGYRTKCRRKTYVCQYCLHPFAKEDQLNEHLPGCSQHQPQQVVYPKPGQNISNLYSLLISVAETKITDIYRTETTLIHWQNTEQVD